MGRALNLGKIPGTGFWRIVLCAVITLVLASAVGAEPIKYTGFTITDGQLGSWAFHNARVILTFVSDTKNVQSNVQFPPTDITANLNIQGRAAITIVGDDKTVHATLVLAGGSSGRVLTRQMMMSDVKASSVDTVS